MKTATSILAVVGSVMLAGQAARPLPNIAAPVMFDTPTSRSQSSPRCQIFPPDNAVEPGYLIDGPSIRDSARIIASASAPIGRSTTTST